MYQIADNQLSETMDLLTFTQSLWNGMVLLLVGMTAQEFSTSVLVLVLPKWSCLHHCPKPIFIHPACLHVCVYVCVCVLFYIYLVIIAVIATDFIRNQY